MTLKLLSFNQSSKENRELLATLYSQGNPPLEDLYLPNIRTNLGSILALFASCDLPFSFAFSAESIADTLAKGSGLSREHQTGDAAFDRKIYISCESGHFMRQYLTPQRRRLIASLLERDFQQLLYLRSSNRLILCCRARYFRKPTDPEQSVKSLLAFLPQDNERFPPVAAPQ